MSQSSGEAVREATVSNEQGLHARPVMRFVDLAMRFRSRITVANISRRGEPLDGKSAMQMMLLEATRGNKLRISAVGDDAQTAVAELVAFIEAGWPQEPAPPAQEG